MLVEVKVPALSESVAEATLLSWRKREGEQVDRGETLIDIETDKVVLELPAPAAGMLAKIIKDDGTTVTSGEIIATIDTEAATAEAGAAAAGTAEGAAQLRVPPAPTASPATEKTPEMMPAARNKATQANLNAEEIGSIKGSGRDGRITKEDVAEHVDRKAAAPSVPTSPEPTREPTPEPTPEPMPTPALVTPQAAPAAIPGGRPEQRAPMSRLRARIAERLLQSQSTAAILTTFNEVNMQAIMDLRVRYKEKFEKEHGVKLGLMSFFVKAAVAALKRFPIVNASVDGNDIIYHGYYDIGIAVSGPRGLVVPILRNAESLSQAQIERQIADFGKRAQDGKLTIEELTGGTFSITNGGVFGSMLSTPIINPPQSAILGIHATKERPVAENGQVVIRPMCYLALSYDHRIIDGREAVLSLVAMKEALEYPMSPLLEG
jgi:2-oxoglutarate dehydrogenase E2 component (dihydrolipoamide succinyltransferase)